MNTIVQLHPLECSDREQFISDNQEAFNYGAMEEFGLRDNHFEEEGQIISLSSDTGQSMYPEELRQPTRKRHSLSWRSLSSFIWPS